jgi:acetyl-CoA synthetase
LTGQAVHAFVTLKPSVLPPDIRQLWLTCSHSEFKFDDEPSLSKELILQVRKVIGPFAAPKKIFIVADLPKTRSGKVRTRFTMTASAYTSFLLQIMRRIMRKIVAGEGDQLGDLSTLAEPGVVGLIKDKVAESA